MPDILQISKCRMCENTHLIPFLNLPQMPLTDYFLHSPEEPEFLADISIHVCTRCWTAQTLHNVDVSEYYKEYAYTVGASAFTGKFMQLLAGSIAEKFFPHKQTLNVIEIGSGDGQQLKVFKNMGHNVLGIEPSEILTRKAIEIGVPTLNMLFTEEGVEQIKALMPEADVVLMTYTFDHIPFPVPILAGVSSLLNPTSSIFVFENHDFEKITERMEFCLFEHEHSIYLHEYSARKALAMNGYRVLDVNWLPQEQVRANSLIVAARPSENISEIRFPESYQKFETPEFYTHFAESITSGIRNFEAGIEYFHKQNKKIAGYGAGGRGVMTLAAVSNAHLLAYVVDKNPKGEHIFMPKTHLPVFGIEKLKHDPVDVIFVFSYGYMAEIMNELAQYGYKPEQFVSMLDLLAGKY